MTPPPALPRSDRLAWWFVAAVWAGMLALLLVFVAKCVPRVPFLDEYSNVHLLVNPLGVPLSDYWRQHNEHRIPLPRILYVAAVRLSGNDFRAPPLLNVVLLAVAAAVLKEAVARARGRTAYTDAAIPLLVMTLGQWDNLNWGFQVQFVSSTVLALFFLATVISPRFSESPVRIATAGVITLLLPCCGANGLALCPAFASLLLFVGIRSVWIRRTKSPASVGWVESSRPTTVATVGLEDSTHPTKSVPRGGTALVGLLLGVLGFAMIPVYFHGYQSVAHHETSRDWGLVAVNVVNFLGVGFGWLAAALHGPEDPGVALFGAAMLVVLIATVVLLIAHLRHAEHRTSAVSIGCVIGGVLCLGLGLAHGRAAMGGILVSNRYTTLAMPLTVAIYVAWSLLPAGRYGRLVPVGIFLVAAGGLWTNTTSAFTIGGVHTANQARIEFEIRGGMPVTFVVDRHHPPELRSFYVAVYQQLRTLGAMPFRELKSDPPMNETPIPVRVVRSEGMTVTDGFYRVTGEKGYVVLALPRKDFVYGLKLTYEAEPPATGRFLNLASWEPGGAYPPRPGYGIIDQFHPTTNGPAAVHVYVNQPTDALRIDLGNPGSAVRVHALGVLTPRP